MENLLKWPFLVCLKPSQRQKKEVWAICQSAKRVDSAKVKSENAGCRTNSAGDKGYLAFHDARIRGR